MVTPVQQRIYEYIQHHISEYGHSPSLTEIAKGIGISPKSVSLVSRSVHALVDEGRLKFNKKGYRNIQVVADESLSLPLVGRIAAGNPIEAIEDRHSVDIGEMIKGGNYYALEVKGDSMVEEGILDGDIVICRQTEQAKEGDIVVALIDALDATLKRISYQIANRITLIPANPTLKPKAYVPNRVQVQGVYVGLLRMRK